MQMSIGSESHPAVPAGVSQSPSGQQHNTQHKKMERKQKQSTFIFVILFPGE